MQEPTHQGGGDVASDLRSDAKQIGNKAADRVHSELDARKDSAVSQAQSVSTAIQRAAGELDEGTPAWLRSAFQQGADQIQRFATTLEQKDSRQMLSEVQTFARERPALFLGACAAAGFAAARIFKAGGQQSGQQQQFSQSGGERTSESSSFGSGTESAEWRRVEADPSTVGASDESGFGSGAGSGSGRQSGEWRRVEADPTVGGSNGESRARSEAGSGKQGEYL